MSAQARKRRPRFAACFCWPRLRAEQGRSKAEAPPPPKVEREEDVNVVHVDHPEQFPLAVACNHISASQLMATGAISPDISRTVPVISLAAGRVVDIHAKLGDTVQKGQVLLRVQSADLSGAFSDYESGSG